MVAAVPDSIYDFFCANETLAVANIHPEITFRMIPEEFADDLQNNFFRIADTCVFNKNRIVKIAVGQMV